MKFSLQDVTRVPWDKFSLNTFLEELPSVAMVFPFLL
jgi:hypothetical protein